MIRLPKSTEFNRRIPKQKFYENLTVSPTLKRFFVDQIKVIYWRNKIAATTMNLAAGEVVTEIEVFEVKLNESKLDESVLRQIDKEIPYHIIFLLEYDGKYQAWTAYKEAAASGNNAFKVGTYYHTDWMDETALPLKIDGLTVDKVYENYVRQIAGDALQTENQERLKDSVERDNRRQELQKQIIYCMSVDEDQKKMVTELMNSCLLDKYKNLTTPAEVEGDFSAIEGTGGYIWPLNGYTRTSSPFGYRICPFHGRELHGGVDIPAPYGTPVHAAKSGTVVKSTYGSSYGNHIIIAHGDGTRTLYAHMSARLVSVGQTVSQGQTIGKVGSTGSSTGNHLHFETWTGSSSSTRVNPMRYF